MIDLAAIFGNDPVVIRPPASAFQRIKGSPPPKLIGAGVAMLPAVADTLPPESIRVPEPQWPRCRGTDPCGWCGRRDWWRSIHDVAVCGWCHPPAAPELVAEWLNRSDS